MVKHIRMNYRVKEYNKLGIEARWLSKEQAF